MSTSASDALVDRVEALRQFVTVVSPHLPDELLVAARGVTGRAGERLALSRDHTVVALAGATGSGKSSLFNAVAGTELSTVGVRRPTTGVAYASVWGSSGASALLDWLGVARRFGQDVPSGPDSDAGNDGSLRGLVLLDLPDFDSVEDTHRVEVDRLLRMVDLIVWVLDPQKYADNVLHRRYLSQFERHRDITVVVLNQADLLSTSDVERCLADLAGLLLSDGLAGVPVLATSTRNGPGIEALLAVLRRTVAARLAVLRRLAGDVDGVVAELAPLVELPAPRGDVDRSTASLLTTALADAAGVPTVARATERAYRHRAVRVTGWPLTRWVRRLRPDPLRRLHLSPTSAGAAVAPRPEPPSLVSTAIRAGVRTAVGSGARDAGDRTPASRPEGLIGVTSLPPAAPAARAAVGLAVRSVADRASEGLPGPWPDAVLAAARSRSGDLTDELDGAVARTDLGLDRRPLWWRAVGLLQWVTTVVALAGLLWLGVRLGLFAIGLPDLVPAPTFGRLQVPTLMTFGGLLAGLLVSVVIRPVILIAARRKGKRAASRLRAAVEKVGAELVLAPIREVRQAYVDARAALRSASPR